MNTAFHYFNDLPWELRDQIWNLVIRPDHRGIHMFKIYNSRKDANAEQNNDVGALNVTLRGLRITAPTCKERDTTIAETDGINTNATGSWKDNNPSTYLIDGGLWTACKESRLVMERYFKGTRTRHLPAKDHGKFLYFDRTEIWNLKKEDRLCSTTGHFSTVEGEEHYFTVVTYRDLFVFQPQNIKTIDWEYLDFDVPIGSWEQGCSGLCNIALEYNPEWGAQVRKAGLEKGEDLPVVQNILRMANQAYEKADKIWIVDYNLKLKQNAPIPTILTAEQEKFRRIQKSRCRKEFVEFRMGNRRFFQADAILGCHLYGSSSDWEYVQEAHDGYNSLQFMEVVGYARDSYIDEQEANEWVQGPILSIGLLGWDYVR